MLARLAREADELEANSHSDARGRHGIRPWQDKDSISDLAEPWRRPPVAGAAYALGPRLRVCLFKQHFQSAGNQCRVPAALVF
jgi:hypothetical protein